MKIALITLCIAFSFAQNVFADSYLDKYCSQYVKPSAYMERDVKTLIADLHSNDVNIRATAADKLSCLAEAALPAVPLMVQLFNEPVGEARLNMISAVAHFGKAAVPSLIEALNSTDRDIRRGACVALEKIGPDASSALLQLKKLLGEPGYDGSHDAAYALGGIGKPAIPTLLDILKNGPDNYRNLIVHKSFSRVKKDEYPKAELIEILKSEKMQARARIGAMQILGYLGADSEDVVPYLINLLGQSDNGIGLAAARALAAIGRPAVPAILQALTSPDALVRAVATYAVKDMPFAMEEAVAILITLSDDKEDTVRYGAISALERIGTKEAIDAVKKAKQKKY